MNPSELFHPEVSAWFERSFPEPTDVQTASWPLIARGKHVLITAPTGSGKTLTAFLWSLNGFAAGTLAPGATRVLYVSPLKALNNDIRRNLLVPLQALEASGGFPAIRAQTRSGDTSQSERQRMLRRPPEILITTPESLFLLLTNRRGRESLATVETVILDEVHSVVDNRRGVHLMTSLERLVDLAGEVQRIALSATVRPLPTVARYVAGFDSRGKARRVEIVETPGSKRIDFRVRFPEAARRAADNGQPIWDPLSEAFRHHIDANEATLFFTNSRSLAEKITFKLNEDLPGPLAYAHHGSLSREIRTAVESRLKAGELKAIVATSSLEMGIDIGHLDEVVLVQAPGSVAATLQRIGRAGHGVGEVSVGTLYPTHALDFLEAAVLTDAVAERDIEPLQVMQGALDVLAQIVVSVCAHEAWPVDQLYRLIVRAFPYRELARDQLELVLEMLAGRYAGSRVRELKPRIHYDRLEGTVTAHKHALLALYNSGGTIPDRGYYKLRHAESGAELGELDEEFVWEAKLGQLFSFGTQNWQIQRITHNDVLVRPGNPNTLAPPFWRAETINRSFHLSARMLSYLEHVEAALAERQDGPLRNELEATHGFDPVAASELIGFLKSQRSATGTPLPHRHHLLLEHVQTGPGGYKGPNNISHLVIHTFWGGRVNRPWAVALEAAWRNRFGAEPEIHADNNAISIQLNAPVKPDVVLGLVSPTNLDALLRESLEGSGFFGARFRECAGRALLLSRRRFDQRLPLWMSRLQAKKLMGAVAEYGDFPVLLEAWRTCIEDEFDLPALTQLLGELQDGVIGYSAVEARTPSPLASNLTFDAVSRYMYADDTPEHRVQSGLSDELIRNALSNEQLRPRINSRVVEQFVSKRQRLMTGYEPETPEEWEDWLKERVLVPVVEATDALVAASRGCHVQRDGRRWLAHPESLHALTRSGLVAADEVRAERIVAIPDEREAEQLCLEILSFYGPLTLAEIKDVLPRVPETLLDDEALLSGRLLDDDDGVRYCDRDNFEALLRMQRAASRPLVEPRGFAELTPFLAAWQGFGRQAEDNTVHDALGQLLGFSAPPKVWLHDLLDARLAGFSDHQLDEAFAELGLIWFGNGREQATLGYPEDLALLTSAPQPSAVSSLFADPGARYGFFQLADRQDQGLEQFNESLWQAVWSSEIYCDSLTALRQGATSRFTLSSRPARAQTRLSARRASARLGSGWSGNWLLRPAPSDAADPLTELEDCKERARMLLERYGLACRELANREGGKLRWALLARALYAMELAGEVVAGYFFSGLSGPQFMTPAALHRFHSRGATQSFWLCALDPASPCGLGSSDTRLPARRESNYLAYFAGELALVIETNGRRLTFHLDPDHPALAEVCAPLVVLARRLKRLQTETINGIPTAESPYLANLDRCLKAIRDHRGVSFEPR